MTICRITYKLGLYCTLLRGVNLNSGFISNDRKWYTMRFKNIILIVLAISIVVSTSYAHSGRTASDGCHFCRTNCENYGYTYDTRHGHQGQICSTSKGPTDPSYSSYIPPPTPTPTVTTPTPTPTVTTPTPTPTVTTPTPALTVTTPTPIPDFDNASLTQEIASIKERLNKTEEAEKKNEVRISWIEEKVKTLLSWFGLN